MKKPEYLEAVKKYTLEKMYDDIFEMNYSQENGEKYKHIIENVKKYVEKC